MRGTDLFSVLDFLNARRCMRPDRSVDVVCATGSAQTYDLVAAGALVGAALTDGGLRWGLLALAGISYIQGPRNWSM